MSNVVTKIFSNQKQWNAMEARATALPRDFVTVYNEIKSYLWKFANGDGARCIAALNDVLVLFEASATDGRRVQDVTGKNVAAFCDERFGGTPPYFNRWRSTLNNNVAKRLATPC